VRWSSGCCASSGWLLAIAGYRLVALVSDATRTPAPTNIASGSAGDRFGMGPTLRRQRG